MKIIVIIVSLMLNKNKNCEIIVNINLIVGLINVKNNATLVNSREPWKKGVK
jgi:hypothetical protein